MADNWMDDREREERDMRRADYVGRWPERGARQYQDEDRSFRSDRDGRSDYYLPQTARPAGSPGRGWQGRDYEGVSPAMRQGGYSAQSPRVVSPRFGSEDYTRGVGGGRFYGDDNHERVYREEYGGQDAGFSPTRAAYHREGFGDPGYGDYSGPDTGETRGERFEQAGHNAGDFLHRAGERVAAWFAGGGEGRAYEPDFDRSVRGPIHGHSGKGPQGYKRSDERISDDAHERLTHDAWVDATDIAISVSGGEVTLSGTVDAREAKHRAERIVEHIAGVNHVQNNLRLAKGSFLTRPASGYGDSVAEAQMRSDDAVANGSGGAGGGQSTAGRKN